MKKVIVLTTGGTIAMKLDEKTGGLVPAVSGDDLIQAVPALKDVCAVEVHEFSNVPSGHITPKMMFEMSHMCDESVPILRWQVWLLLMVQIHRKKLAICLV